MPPRFIPTPSRSPICPRHYATPATGLRTPSRSSLPPGKRNRSPAPRQSRPAGITADFGLAGTFLGHLMATAPAGTLDLPFLAIPNEPIAAPGLGLAVHLDCEKRIFHDHPGFERRPNKQRPQRRDLRRDRRKAARQPGRGPPATVIGPSQADRTAR